MKKILMGIAILTTLLFAGSAIAGPQCCPIPLKGLSTLEIAGGAAVGVQGYLGNLRPTARQIHVSVEARQKLISILWV